jgi:hypothetical protein
MKYTRIRRKLEDGEDIVHMEETKETDEYIKKANFFIGGS